VCLGTASISLPLKTSSPSVHTEPLLKSLQGAAVNKTAGSGSDDLQVPAKLGLLSRSPQGLLKLLT